jgi:hypothetical protein
MLGVFAIGLLGCGPTPPYVGTYKLVDTPQARELAKTIDNIDAHAGKVKGPKQIDIMLKAVITVSSSGQFRIDHPYDDSQGYLGTYTISGNVMTVINASGKYPSNFLFNKKNLTLTQNSMGTDLVYKKQ